MYGDIYGKVKDKISLNKNKSVIKINVDCLQASEFDKIKDRFSDEWKITINNTSHVYEIVLIKKSVLHSVEEKFKIGKKEAKTFYLNYDEKEVYDEYEKEINKKYPIKGSYMMSIESIGTQYKVSFIKCESEYNFIRSISNK